MLQFLNFPALENHVRLHLNQRPFNCDIDGCGKSFASKLVLHSHKQYFHMKMPRKCYICEICAKVCEFRFSRMQQLHFHFMLALQTKTSV